MLEYSKSLKDRNSYLDTTENLRRHAPHYAPCYASAIAPPQVQNPPLTQTRRTGIKGNAYKKLQSPFSHPTILTRHDPKWRLYVNLVSKARNFRAMIYHCTNEEQAASPSSRTTASTVTSSAGEIIELDSEQ